MLVPPPAPVGDTPGGMAGVSVVNGLIWIAQGLPLVLVVAVLRAVSLIGLPMDLVQSGGWCTRRP